MTAFFEITERFIEPGDAGDLLYAPLLKKFTYRKTRRYGFEYEGDEIKLTCFVADTLVDKISQTLIGGEAPAVKGARFAIDYGMKPGALDLEKEAVVAYYKGLENPGFEITELKIRQRIYVFPQNAGDKANPEVFIRDICNGAIHNWSVIGN